MQPRETVELPLELSDVGESGPWKNVLSSAVYPAQRQSAVPIVVGVKAKP